MKRIVLLGVVGLICAATRPALAWNHRRIVCDGFLKGAIDGDVVVPTGKSCTLSAATINGKLTTQRGALVVGISGSTVKGRVRIDAVDRVDIENSHFQASVKLTDVGRKITSCLNTFEHNFTIKDSAGEIALGRAGCHVVPGGIGDTVHGMLVVAENTASVEVVGLSIDESAFFHHNTGFVVLGSNMVEDNLFCHDNVPKAVATDDAVGGTNTCGG
jgi:hypothetical protein